MTLDEFLALPGAKRHDGGWPPEDWDGEPVLLADGTEAMPRGWMWLPLCDIHVIAYREAP